jgi:hypothetical protein
MRSYNDGRYLEIDLKLSKDGKGITWGFALGEIETAPCCESTRKVSGPNEPKLPSVPGSLEDIWN